MDDMDVLLRYTHNIFFSIVLRCFPSFPIVSFHLILFSVFFVLFCFDASWVCRYCVFTWPYFILDVFPHSSFSFTHSFCVSVCLLWILQFPFSGVLCVCLRFMFSSSSSCYFSFYIYFIRIVCIQFIFSVSSLLYCFLFDFCIIFCFSLVDGLTVVVAVAFVSLSLSVSFFCYAFLLLV